MSTATKISKSMTHARVYVGAPYGDGEGGHIQSLHKSEDAARRAGHDLDNCIVVALDEPYGRGFDGQTAREYFAD